MPSFIHRARTDLVQLAANGADDAQIADRAIGLWTGVDAALSPIIGERGFAALFKRSLLLAGAEHAALLGVLDATDTSGYLAGLRATLGQQSSADAVRMHGALLQTFCDLLARLIGESLTERLLQPVQDNLSGDSAAEEQSP